MQKGPASQSPTSKGIGAFRSSNAADHGHDQSRRHRRHRRRRRRRYEEADPRADEPR